MKNIRTLKLVGIDVVISIATVFFSLLLRFEFSIPINYYFDIINWIPIIIFTQIFIFYSMSLYDSIWRFTGIIDLFDIVKSVSLASLISFFLIITFLGLNTFPRSIPFLYLIINFFLISFSRLSVRIYYTKFYKGKLKKDKKDIKKILLIGAGLTGEKIAREILNTNSSSYKIMGFIDDDPKKFGQAIHGVRVICNVRSIPSLKIEYDEIIICAPSATGVEIRNFVKYCKKTGKHYKILPSFSELLDKDVSMSMARDVSYADLLGRKEIKLDFNSIENMIKGKRILISGCGGSIGSELLKQSLLFQPSEIVCIDNNEQKIFDIGEISNQNKYGTTIKPALVDINDKNQLEKVFNDNRPQIVMHAAAFKHVPIQEVHPWTAVKTNINGTMNIIEISDKYLTEKFVLVSTDKAVNPVNVMGATKRIAEKLIQSFNLVSKTQFMAVRFGNVLGSSGSAIPVFQKQINKGGPITITHPEMTRYFMSIPEASQLILQCGSIGNDGEIFLLEMGTPIKIDQMARDLIKLSGLEPEKDIPIVYIGLRPGEKLYEELQYEGEKKIFTNHKKIMILKDEEKIIPWKKFKFMLLELIDISRSLDQIKIISKLRELVPNYRPVSFSNIPRNNQNKHSYHIQGKA